MRTQSFPHGLIIMHTCSLFIQFSKEHNTHFHCIQSVECCSSVMYGGVRRPWGTWNLHLKCCQRRNSCETEYHEESLDPTLHRVSPHCTLFSKCMRCFIDIVLTKKGRCLIWHCILKLALRSHGTNTNNSWAPPYKHFSTFIHCWPKCIKLPSVIDVKQ